MTAGLIPYQKHDAASLFSLVQEKPKYDIGLAAALAAAVFAASAAVAAAPPAPVRAATAPFVLGATLTLAIYSLGLF